MKINSLEQIDILRTVLDNLVRGMVVVDKDYRVLAFNQLFVDFFQLTPGTMKEGEDFRNILTIWAQETKQDQAMLERAIRELAMPEPFDFEFAQDIRGEVRWCHLFHNPLPGGGFVRTFTDITERKTIEKEKEKLIEELQEALSEVQTLRGILPICSFCKNIRDDKGYWRQVESYFQHHSGILFSHSLCPQCAHEHYPNFFNKDTEEPPES